MEIIARLKKLFKDKQIRRQTLFATMVLASGVILSLTGFIKLREIAYQQMYVQLQQHMDLLVKQIQTNIDISLDSLAEIAKFYQVNGKIYRSQFAEYIKSDTKYHSGTIALGWVPKIQQKEISQFEKRVRRMVPGFSVYELTGHGMPVPIKKHKWIYPIEYIISLKNKEMKPGLNIAFIPSRMHTLKEAERTQKTAITQHVTFYLNNLRINGFQAFHPVFKKDVWGQKKLIGYVMGNYDIAALIEGVFSGQHFPIDVAVYDISTAGQQLLYSSSPLFDSVDAVMSYQEIHWTYTLRVANRQWVLVTFPRMNILADHTSAFPYAVLIAGTSITLLLTLYLFIALVRTRQLALLQMDLAGKESDLDRQIRLKQEADKANREKSGLLTAASHDLRQPLHTIGLLATLLKDNSNKQDQNKFIDKILTAVEAMNTLFTNLLDFNLLETRQLPVHQQHFYLQDIFDKLEPEFTLRAKEKNLAFHIVETSCCLYTDPVLLERILRNLLSNAFRYTVQGKIILGCRRGKDDVRICVADTGIGLSAESRKRVFDSFYRDTKAKKMNSEGLGLGLSIVQQAIRTLDLQLDLQSQVDRGSIFYINVPYGDPGLIGETGNVRLPNPLHRKVWLIEDDQTIRESLSKILQTWQCKVTTLASSQELSQLFENEEKPDIIIADYQLDDETGLELIIQIRHHFQETIPALVISASTQTDIQKKVEQEACAFEIKPIDSDTLNQKLQYLLHI